MGFQFKKANLWYKYTFKRNSGWQEDVFVKCMFHTLLLSSSGLELHEDEIKLHSALTVQTFGLLKFPKIMLHVEKNGFLKNMLFS